LYWGAKYISTFDIPDGVKYLVYFYSRYLNTAERNSVSEKECLGVVDAIKRFRGFIEYTHFIVETDHQAPCWLKSIKEPTGRLAGWALELQGCDLHVVYKSASENRVADALSRAPVLLLEESDKLTGVASSLCQKYSGPFISSDKHFESINEYTCPVSRNIVAGLLRVSNFNPFLSRNRSQQDVNEGRSGLEEVPVCDVSNGPKDPVRKGEG
jgi:hypothetical protein